MSVKSFRSSILAQKIHGFIFVGTCQMENIFLSIYHKYSFLFSGKKPLRVYSSFRDHRQTENSFLAAYRRASMKVLFTSSEPHSLSRVHPVVSTGDITNPARGHQCDVYHQRRLTGNSQAIIELGYESGLPSLVGILSMSSRSSSSKSFSCLMHLPKPSNKFLSNSNFSFSSNLSGTRNTIIHSLIGWVRTNQGISSLTQYPPKSSRTSFRDIAARDFPSTFFSSLSKSSIGSNSVDKHEFINSGIKEFPEPLIHVNRFNSAMNRYGKEGK